MFSFWETQDDLPPPPASSSVFVMRNGRYEPQNLMPVLPRPDVLDFDGFVVRRGAAAGYRHARPPEMRQASLLRNPISIRRDSAKITAIEGARNEDADARCLQLSFTFDANRPGTLSLFLLVAERETSSTRSGGLVERTIELRPQAPKEGDDGQRGPVTRDTRHFKAGLGQVYESPPLNLESHMLESLGYDPDRPKDIPLAVRLDADGGGTEESCTHLTYMALYGGARLDSTRSPQWSAQIFAQKLQYGGQCFVLHEVFGVNSKSLDVDADCGNSDCVICLSAPRDTAVLPCRHMCFCSYCAGIVRLQCDRCPVCRQKVQSLLQFRRDWEAQPAIAAQPAQQLLMQKNPVTLP